MPPKYEKKDPLRHMLLRPDMYIGSTTGETVEQFVADEDFTIHKRTVTYSPGILRIFIEPLSNIIDNVARSKDSKTPVTKVCININPETGETTFWNDGEVIPIEMHAEGCYNHTLIFGHLFTSSNYNDDIERLDISGRNGVGVKASNVFSTKFTVEGVDPTTGLHLSQTWEDNIKTMHPPVITKSKKKVGYTKISFFPDFALFGLKGYTPDILAVYRKCMVDMAMLAKVKVFYNDTQVPVSSFLDYAKLYTSTAPPEEVLYTKTDNCEVVLMPSESEYECISFASGVCTPLGGVHVDPWNEAFFRPIIAKLNKPNQPTINIKDVKNCFRIFVKASVVNPKYETQAKLKLTDPTVKAEVKPSMITKILKWSCIERLTDIIDTKNLVSLKSIERKKKGYTKIENLTSANNEGKKNASECILILVEGDSPATFAKYGIASGAYGKKGPDWFGVYKLRGKVLNCRNSTMDSISANKVIEDIIKALNLRIGVDYTDNAEYKTLRYGKLMLLTDADVDGIHISALVQNMIHYLFPSILKREEPFIVSMQTPIVSVTLQKKELLFYDEARFKAYVREYSAKHPTKKIESKYYKGLGTSEAKMAKRTFGVKMIEFEADDTLTDTMTKVFHKKYADQRKEWLKEYDSSKQIIEWDGADHEILRITLSDFLNTELIKFSLRDCARSLPNLIDGLKESQRKILYAGFRKGIDYNKPEIKVAQFGGYVAEHTGYHHGEQNLYDTLIKMAQSFIGSNNIPLFMRRGMFGTRSELGKDAASARYIFTTLEEITRYLFIDSDEPLLEYNEDDGAKVEPRYYVPIIPMILVNGCNAGIGTGWSCAIPCFNPLDLISAVKIWLENDGQVLSKEDDGVVSSKFPELSPWYNTFTGEIKKIDEDKYVTYGRVVNGPKNTRIVEELPVGLSISDFLSHLTDLKANGTLDFKNNCTPNKANVTLYEGDEKLTMKDLKLISHLSTTNMVLFNASGRIQKFESVDEIINDFCVVRYELYKRRKAYMVKKLEVDLCLVGNKKRFLTEVIRGDIKLFEDSSEGRVAREKDELTDELTKKEFAKIDGDYDYLLSLQIRSITKENIGKLEKEYYSLGNALAELTAKSEKSMWLEELGALEAVYTKTMNTIASQLAE